MDEYHYTQWLGKSEAGIRLQAHWSTWFTEYDFQAMAKYGLNHVRIPIGYWAFYLLENDPYVQGQEYYLDRAIEWARNAGLKVWIDLHGAPGSQNGFDNSGLRESYEWQNGNNVDITLRTIQYIATKYGSSYYSGVVTSIELLNEPLGPAFDMGRIKDFYLKGYDIVRKAGPSMGITIHDAFMNYTYWNGFMETPNYWFVTLDHHQYQVFSSEEVSRSIEEHISTACQIGRKSKSEFHWRITGEFSAALTDCTKWLNGVGRGARYDGTYHVKEATSNYVASCKNRWDFQSWSLKDIEKSRRFIEAQLEAYDQGSGWIFWTYKTENALEWDFRRLIDYGIFPFPFNDRHFPNTCGF